MIQGTASDAGKSVLVAGLCRLAARRGVRVAPFKSQNMSLNAAVTARGEEIGRAQALQAIACGRAPSVSMNPILLKPEGESRSQIILEGRPVGRADFAGYADYRARCVAAIDSALGTLATEVDLVIAEGAGSPAEINLMDRDLANMFVARRTDAEVWLVGDIDRGGVFASLFGTLALLPEEDRRRVAGLVMNRFRGDVALLRPGLEMLHERTKVPTLGVVPFLHDLGLPEEDGQSIEVRNQSRRGSSAARQVVVVRYPRISNHDDFLPLESDARVELRYIDDPAAVDGADVAILPGSKATRADLAWLRERGFPRALDRLVQRGGRLLGICGGYQMLGARIVDTEGVEGAVGESKGLGWLPVETHFESEKDVRPITVHAAAAAQWLTRELAAKDEVHGYVIHCGRMVPLGRDHSSLFRRAGDGGECEGTSSANVAGTLVHGLFEAPAIRAALLGLVVSDAPWNATIESALDRLADVLEASLDPTALRRAIGS